MSKELDEAIKKLYDIIDGDDYMEECPHCKGELDNLYLPPLYVYDVVKILEELNQPAQYVVRYVIDTIPSGWRKKETSWAVPISIHAQLTGRYDSVEGMKEAVLKEFNSARLLLNLTRITMEQITFVEV